MSVSPPPHYEGSRDSLQMSPGLENSNPGNIVTEGKRVTVNHVIDSKPSILVSPLCV